jgi:hypothetical protein
MSELYRFSWNTLVELLRAMPAITLLQFTGALVSCLH